MSDPNPNKYIDLEGLKTYHGKLNTSLEPSRVHNLLSGITTTAGNANSGSYLSVKWTVSNVDGVTTPYDGMKILVRIPLAGVGTAGAVLSIDGGTTYHPVAYNTNTVFTTHYAVNTTKLFVYHATQTMVCYLSSNTKTTATGVWQGESNYVDGNTVITYGTLAYYHRPYAASAIYRYKICMADKDNRLVPLTSENVTGAYASSTSYSVGTIVYYTASSVTKLYKCIQAGKGKTPSSQTAYWQVVHTTPTDVAFKPDKFYWYNTTTTISAGGAVGANTLMSNGYNATNIVVSNFDTDIPTYRMIYLCGTYNRTTGLFTLRGGGTTGTDYYVLVPDNTANITLSNYFTSGYDYILLGASYSSTNYMHLREDHPMYRFDGTNLVPYDTWNENRIEGLVPSDYLTSISSSDVTNALGFTPTANTGTVIGSSLTSDKIVVGNSGVNIKVSSYSVNDIKDIAEGKTASYVIATKACITGTEYTNGNFDNVSAILTAESGGTSLDLSAMNVGDNIYITEIDVPDYWVASKTTSNGSTVLALSKLETTKVDISGFYTKPSGGIPSTDLADSYLKLDGTTTMTGALQLQATGNNQSNIGSNGIRWNSTSLPEQTSPQYFCVIDGFANGGRQKWASLANVKTALNIPSAVTESTVSGWGFTKSVGSVTSVSAGDGLVIAEDEYVNPQVCIDSGYKLPTTTEWSAVGTVKKVNNTSPDANGNVSLTIPAAITINTTNKTISDGTNTLTFGSNAFNSTTIPTTYVSTVNGSSGAITNVAKTNADNSFSTTQTFKDVTLYSASGDSPRLTFQRGTLTDTYNDWSVYDSGGLLYIQQRGSGSSSWETRATFSQSGTNFVGTLQQGGVNVVTTSGSQALTNKTYNGYTLGAACAKALASSISSSDTGLVTAQQVYNALSNAGGDGLNMVNADFLYDIGEGDYVTEITSAQRQTLFAADAISIADEVGDTTIYYKSRTYEYNSAEYVVFEGNGILGYSEQFIISDEDEVEYNSVRVGNYRHILSYTATSVSSGAYSGSGKLIAFSSNKNAITDWSASVAKCIVGSHLNVNNNQTGAAFYLGTMSVYGNLRAPMFLVVSGFNATSGTFSSMQVLEMNINITSDVVEEFL